MKRLIKLSLVAILFVSAGSCLGMLQKVLGKKNARALERAAGDLSGQAERKVKNAERKAKKEFRKAKKELRRLAEDADLVQEKNIADKLKADVQEELGNVVDVVVEASDKVKVKARHIKSDLNNHLDNLSEKIGNDYSVDDFINDVKQLFQKVLDLVVKAKDAVVSLAGSAGSSSGGRGGSSGRGLLGDTDPDPDHDPDPDTYNPEAV